MKKLFELRSPKRKTSHLLGLQAEQKARRYLENKGLQFVTQNFRCKAGEIDLVMRSGDEWVFVEVKFRQNNYYGTAAEYFTRSKATKVKRAIAQYFLMSGHNSEHTAHRIDLVAIDGDEIQWLQAVD